MDVIFFAIRPMFSATERASLSRSSFVANIRIRYISRQRSAFRSISLYNVFSIRSVVPCDFRSIERFSNSYGFFLIASFANGYILSISETKKLFSFSSVKVPLVLLGCSTLVFISMFVKMIFLSFFNKKWLQ